MFYFDAYTTYNYNSPAPGREFCEKFEWCTGFFFVKSTIFSSQPNLCEAVGKCQVKNSIQTPLLTLNMHLTKEGPQ